MTNQTKGTWQQDVDYIEIVTLYATLPMFIFTDSHLCVIKFAILWAPSVAIVIDPPKRMTPPSEASHDFRIAPYLNITVILQERKWGTMENSFQSNIRGTSK